MLIKVAPAVAKAAMETGVAQKPIEDLAAYSYKLEMLQSRTRGFIRTINNRVKAAALAKKREVPLIYFPEGRSTKILKALGSIMSENVCRPVLMGDEDQVRAKIKELELDQLLKLPIIQPSRSPKYAEYVKQLFEARKRKGVMNAEAETF